MNIVKKGANILKMKAKIFTAVTKKLLGKFISNKKSACSNQIEKTPEVISVKSLISKLEEHGISSQDTILIHSSFKALGKFIERPNKIISELKSWMADGGTILFPTFTMASTQYNEVSSHSTFDLDNKKITTGVLPGFASKDKGFQRSFHPTHSVVGFGKYSGELLDEHGKDGTATGVTSPFYKMMQFNGKIINLGVGLNQTTAVHSIEEVPSGFFPIRSISNKSFNVSVSKGGRSESFKIKPLRPELYHIRDVEQLKTPLIEAGALVEIEFGDGIIQIIDSVLLYKTLKKLTSKGETIYGKWF